MMSPRYLLGLAVILVAVSLGCNGSSTFPDLPVECGGFQGLACAADQLCELPVGECNTADLAGICLPRPDVCTADFVPVCGCDGVTYGNDCNRLVAGVQKARDGEC